MGGINLKMRSSLYYARSVTANKYPLRVQEKCKANSLYSCFARSASNTAIQDEGMWKFDITITTALCSFLSGLPRLVRNDRALKTYGGLDSSITLVLL